jgi:hypothetical protein
MNVIVPLAGRDFIQPDGCIKPLSCFRGSPIISYALNTRPWADLVSSYTFILRDSLASRGFASEHLSTLYPDSRQIFLSHHTRGAALSALAGLASLDRFDQPIVVDLADIVYSSSINILRRYEDFPAADGIALVFQSVNPRYSYLATDDQGVVVEAAEKRVISSNASAGTYVFRNSSCLLRAIAHAIDNEKSQTFEDLFYVCPLFNGVLACNRVVLLETVYDVHDIKKA